MSDDPTSNQKDKPTESNQPNPTETSSTPPPSPAEPRQPVTAWSDRLKLFGSKIGTLNFLLLGLVLSVALAVYLSSRDVPSNDSNPSTQLIIVQLNDIYRLDAVRAGKRGGLARVVALLRQLKTQNPQVPILMLHAGDFLSPSLESDVFHGSQMIDAMNFINDVAPLYVVPGNHEFDYLEADKGHLTAAILKSKFPWVASNLERNDLALLPALRDNVRQNIVVPFGKVKLGIFGLTIDGAQSGKDRPYAAISGDYARIASAEIEQLESEGADLIVGLTHLNIGDDRELAKLKQQHPRFLWIAGGHEHSLDRESGSTGAALITKGDSNARTVWKVSVVKEGRDVDIREESVVIDESIQPDPAFTQNVENFYRAKLRNVRPHMDAIISTIPNYCYDGTEEAVRDRESNWGNFLTDTMRTAYKSITADVAVLNGGSIRIDDTICDRITFENLERTFAYPTPVVFVKLKGKDLKKYILDSSASSKRGDGRFLQVSGVSFRRDLSADPSEVIKDLEVSSGKRPIAFDEAKTYVVAVNEYIFCGGDGYKFRQFVTEYIPAGPDLRALTFAALSGQTKNKTPVVGRIIDLPIYVKLPSLPAPKWQTLSAADQPKGCVPPS
ncbi:MAG: 5'-nucleotidase C-terminal domain-containing protein [Acidobacteriota bacterium]